MLRAKYNVNYKSNEIIFEGSPLWTLVGVGAVGGFVAGALGLGGGSVYCPIFLTLGLDPRVASGTSIYLVFYSAISASVVNLLYGLLDVQYALFVSFWAIFGVLLVIWQAELYVKKTSKMSVFVWTLVVVFGLSCIVQPIFAYFNITAQTEGGVPLMGWNSVC
jgi:uncharacterized membrane protein YfcA